jgi:hypothetical protein
MRLPFVPGPMAGEGLPSWTARLAAHNFVDVPTFWRWLGDDEIDDLKPSPKTINALAEVTGEPASAIGALCLSQARRSAWMAAAGGDGRRGGACPGCCRDATAEGRDHSWPAQSAMLFWVSCPIHRCALVDLDAWPLILGGGVLRLARRDGGVLGAPRATRTLSEHTLALEATLAGALVGRRPGRSWRVRSAGDLLRTTEILIDMVLYKESGEVPFAWLFEPERIGGPAVFCLQPSDPTKGLAALQGQSMRTRRNVLSALAALFGAPALLTGDIADALAWRTSPDHQGPYLTLVDQMGENGRRRLNAALPRLPRTSRPWPRAPWPKTPRSAAEACTNRLPLGMITQEVFERSFSLTGHGAPASFTNGRL